MAKENETEKFYKDQIVDSEFGLKYNRSLLNIVLKEDVLYSYEDVEKLMNRELKRRVD